MTDNTNRTSRQGDRSRPAGRCRGFTILELLIGIAVGLIVVTGALLAFGASVRTSSDTIRSARLNQDLGAAMMFMSNEIRRAGGGLCNRSSYSCWTPDGTELPYINPANMTDVTILDNGDTATGSVTSRDCLLYQYNVDMDATADTNERRGVRLNNGALEIRASGSSGTNCGTGTWRVLTDPTVITITDLEFTSTDSKCRNTKSSTGGFWKVTATDAEWFPCSTSVPLADVKLCNASGSTCATPGSRGALAASGDPLVEEKIVNITLTGQLASDSSMSKTLTTSVRLFNNEATKEP